MTRERWQQVESLYHAALERDPSQRSAFLSKACQGDGELRREIESLLRQDGSWLDQPAWQEAPTLIEDVTGPGLARGAQLGPYHIEGPLGAGGMGEVSGHGHAPAPHGGHQDPSTRQGGGPGPGRRFMQEARAASALNHPNIVTVYDIASDNAVDYLVMEHVPGESLAKLITHKGLPLDGVIEYGTQIAGALAAAHAHAIVHRDIKPANIMLTEEGQVKILDFGLAKLQERASGPESATRTMDPR